MHSWEDDYLTTKQLHRFQAIERAAKDILTAIEAGLIIPKDGRSLTITPLHRNLVIALEKGLS